MKGKLIIIGGAEEKGLPSDTSNGDDFTKNGILKRVIDESPKGKDSRVEIVPAASTKPEEMGAEYMKAFHKLGAQNTGVLNLRSRANASDPKFLKRIEAADAIFFTGGNQLQLTHLLGGTPFFTIIEEKLRQGNFMYAGTSAGAASISESMIIEGSSENAILKGEVKTTGGFGLLSHVIFDTHFMRRGRIGRLFQIILSNPEILGVGIEENTGLMITGNRMEAIGPGMTILLDGRSIRNSNLLEIRDGAPLSIDNLTLHVMSKTDVFDLKTRELKIITPPECRI